MGLPKWRVQLKRVGLKTDPKCGETRAGEGKPRAFPAPAVLLKDSSR